MTDNTEYDCSKLSGEFPSDCSFVVGSEKTLFKCNKRILALKSPVFHKMFFGALKEDTENSISLPDVNPKAFYIYLKFVYLAKTYGYPFYDNPLDVARVFPEIYYIADKYLTPTFWNECIDVAKSIVREFHLKYHPSMLKYIYKIYTTACVTDLKELKEICEKKFCLTEDQLKYQHILKSILYLPVEAFVLIIKHSSNGKIGVTKWSPLFRTIDNYAITNNLVNDDNEEQSSKSDSKKK